MSQLTIHLNSIAALREMRRASEPDPSQAAVLAELAGADGIAVQVRRDRKFIRDRDLYLLNTLTKTRLTVEMPPSDELIERMIEVRPSQVVLIADGVDPEGSGQTVDFSSPQLDYKDLTARFKGVDVTVGYFVEPEHDQIKGASKAGANAVLIDCGAFTGARTAQEAQAELDRIDAAGRYAAKSGLSVMLGRGITYRNVTPLAELGFVEEFVVGHAVFSRAMLVGLDRAVREMTALVRETTRPR